MEKIKSMLKKKFLNTDGTINKTVVASFITLALLMIQQIMVACGFSYGHWDQIAGIINTVLALLSIAGFVEGNGDVTPPVSKEGKVSETQTTQTK